jgi:hypothetical protein
VDPLYGSGIKGNIFYTNLTFNASDQTIALKGNTTTEDTLNFSLISDLMDALEQSTLFSNVSDRSFSKNSEQGDAFNSSFSIELQLQTGTDARDEVIPKVLSTPASKSLNTETDTPETAGPDAASEATSEPSEEPASPEAPSNPVPTSPETVTETSEPSLTESTSTNVVNVFDSLSSFWGAAEETTNDGHVPRE